MNRNSHYWINKNKRKEKAIKHTDDMERLYAKEIAESVKQTRLYSDNTVIVKHPKTTDKMVVVDADSVSAIFRYHEEGKKMAVLNFASYKNPGGMFLNGSSAQEESLCHSSFLYNVLSEFPGYYEWNQQYKNRALYTNRALYSPNIRFFQDGRKNGHVGSVLCDVITCAAPNKATAQKYCNVSEEENHEALESRIRFVLQIAETENVDTLILGAFGSGVFGQDGTEVAKIFLKLLTNEFWTFKKVIFAIPHDIRNGNYEKFAKII